jgi:hypothetical protein
MENVGTRVNAETMRLRVFGKGFNPYKLKLTADRMGHVEPYMTACCEQWKAHRSTVATTDAGVLGAVEIPIRGYFSGNIRVRLPTTMA